MASPSSLTSRFLNGARLLVLAAVALTAVGFIGHGVGLVLLTTTLGPTAYLLLAHPESEQSRLRSALIGHGAAIACGLAALAVFGLWTAPSIAETRRDTDAQIGAQAVAVGVTLLLLVLLDAHHPPAGATALLISSGIDRPGPGLYGLLVGLALLIALAALLARVPKPAGLLRSRGQGGQSAEEDGERPPERSGPDRPGSAVPFQDGGGRSTRHPGGSAESGWGLSRSAGHRSPGEGGGGPAPGRRPPRGRTG